MAALTPNSSTTPAPTSQSGPAVAANSKDFKLFPFFPAEIQAQIFVEAAYAPRCHLFFVTIGVESHFMVLSRKDLKDIKEVFGPESHQITTAFDPRLPVSGEDDRLSIRYIAEPPRRPSILQALFVRG